MNRELEAIIAAAHMVSTLARPDLTRRVRRAVERGELVALLPGVYVRPGTSLDAVARARAITLADPAAVVCGAWAARLTFWSDLPEPKDLTVAVTRRFDPRPGFEFVRRRVPRSLTRRMPDYRVTARALTALDLVDEFGGDAIDTALRSGATLAQLKDAFAATTRRPGNALRRDLLEESRDVPWSPAERAAHVLLRRAGIVGWVANAPVSLSCDGRPDAYFDIAFPDLRLAFEIDGYSAHSSYSAFVRDRVRDLRAGVRDWEVHRVPAVLVLNSPEEFIALVTALVDRRSRTVAS